MFTVAIVVGVIKSKPIGHLK